MNARIDFTEEELRRFSPRINAVYVRGLIEGKETLAAAGILANGKRLAHFLAQFGAETQGGQHVRENLNYKTVERIRAVWPARAKKETTATLSKLVRNPVALGDWAYGRRELGNRKGTSDGFEVTRWRGAAGCWVRSRPRRALAGLRLVLPGLEERTDQHGNICLPQT